MFASPGYLAFRIHLFWAKVSPALRIDRKQRENNKGAINSHGLLAGRYLELPASAVGVAMVFVIPLLQCLLITPSVNKQVFHG